VSEHNSSSGDFAPNLSLHVGTSSFHCVRTSGCGRPGISQMVTDPSCLPLPPCTYYLPVHPSIHQRSITGSILRVPTASSIIRSATVYFRSTLFVLQHVSLPYLTSSCSMCSITVMCPSLRTKLVQWPAHAEVEHESRLRARECPGITNRENRTYSSRSPPFLPPPVTF